MKYCYQCGRITTGEPLFCNFCARSYDAKLCPRHHPNPRIAEACSRCGSRELSTPQPKVSLWWHVLGFLLRSVLGLFLALLSLIVLVSVTRELLTMPAVQNGLVALGLLVAALWWAWGMLPHWLRKLIRRVTKRREHGDER